jgi:hypothetical protein
MCCFVRIYLRSHIRYPGFRDPLSAFHIPLPDPYYDMGDGNSWALAIGITLEYLILIDLGGNGGKLSARLLLKCHQLQSLPILAYLPQFQRKEYIVFVLKFLLLS